MERSELDNILETNPEFKTAFSQLSSAEQNKFVTDSTKKKFKSKEGAGKKPIEESGEESDPETRKGTGHHQVTQEDNGF